jgi:hypothetical protein
VSWLDRLDAALAQRECEKSERSEKSRFPRGSGLFSGEGAAKKAPLRPSARRQPPLFAGPRASDGAEAPEKRLFSHTSDFSHHDEAGGTAGGGARGAPSGEAVASADAPAPAQRVPPGAVGWLGSIGRAVRRALAEGGVAVADEDGWVTVVRPDRRRVVVSPDTAARLAAAGLLPDLPPPVDEAEAADDSIDAAERMAVASEPALPPEGTPERAPG